MLASPSVTVSISSVVAGSATTTPTILVSYTVTASCQYTQSQLISQLTTAVSSGEFTTSLQTKALASGATYLETASSTATYLTILSSSPTSSPDIPSFYPTSGSVIASSFMADQVIITTLFV